MTIRKAAMASIIVIGLGAASGASAQTWGGFYLDGAIGARSTNTEVNLSSTSIPVGIFADNQRLDFGQTNFLGTFSGGWRWAGGAIVGFGAFFDLAGTDAGEAVSTSTLPLPATTDIFKVKQKSRYGLSIDVGPNWRTHPYAKLTYAWGKFEVEGTTTGCSSITSSNTHTGFGLGGGVRHLQTTNLYFFAEVMWQDFNSKSSNATLSCGGVPVANVSVDANPTNVVGVVGLGWKF